MRIVCKNSYIEGGRTAYRMETKTMTKNEAAMTVSLAYTDALSAIRKAQSLTEITGEQWKAEQPVAGVDRFIVSRA